MPEVKAKIINVKETEFKSNYAGRKFVAFVDYEGDYPQPIEFECFEKIDKQKVVEKLNHIFPDDIINISYNLRGRFWENPSTGENKVFNTISVWKIEVLESVRSATVKNNPPKVETKNTLSSKTEPDGLPF
jgi:hypothetical protein